MRKMSLETNGGASQLSPVSLSPLAQKNLDDVWIAVRGLQEKEAAAAPSRSDYRADLSRHLSQIETFRSGRLSSATMNIPDDFWVILLLFVVAASILSGRRTAKRFGIQVNIMHMSAIGLAVGMVVVLDNPFRGETSIGPEIIEQAWTPSPPREEATVSAEPTPPNAPAAVAADEKAPPPAKPAVAGHGGSISRNPVRRRP